MERYHGPAIVIPGFLLFVTLAAGEAGNEEIAGPSWSPQAAANYLDGRAEWWLKWSGAARGQGTACASCHTSTPIALALPALGKQLGETASGVIETGLIDNFKKRVENWEKIEAGSESGKEPFRAFYSDKELESLGTESVLNALILVNHDVRRAKRCLERGYQEGARQPLGTAAGERRLALARCWAQPVGEGRRILRRRSRGGRGGVGRQELLRAG